MLMTQGDKATRLARDRYLRRTYDISADEFDLIVEAQGGKCPVCERDLSGLRGDVDHDHVSGIIRGILCRFDNHRVVGRHRDWRVLARATEYLRDPPAVIVLGERRAPKKKPRKRRRATRRKTTASTIE
jgi:hypothetical protein